MDEPFIVLCPHCFEEFDTGIEYYPVGLNGKKTTCPHCNQDSYIYEDEDVGGSMVHSLMTYETWTNFMEHPPE